MAKVGRPKVFETPEELEEYFEEYKEDVKANPILIQKWVGKDGDEVDQKHYKPLTWMGFEAFCYRKGLLTNMDQYRTSKGGYKEFSAVVRAIGAEMFENKFSGAAIGIYQQNIIARELGLAEKKEVQNFDRPILEGGKALPSDDTQSDDDLLGSTD